MQTKSCSVCGVPLAADAPFGHCPVCLLTPPAAPPKPRRDPGSETLSGRRVIGDYELQGQLGRGGMGVVYRARQVSLNRTVAVKMLLNSSLSSPAMVRRFEMEAETVARLDHPHIVPIYEVREEDGQRYFSMRLVEGESLSHRIARGEFSLHPAGTLRKEQTWAQIQEHLVRLMVVIARAVHYAHTKGVLHRDLKPANILIDAAGEPHLTDFGLAKCFEEGLTPEEKRSARQERMESLPTDSAGAKAGLTGSGEILGTPAYMAPEQATGKPVSKLTDIYSLGAIFYQLITGRPPFEGATPLETLRQIESQEPARPESLNPRVARDLSVICLKCLEKEPTRRYGTAQALAEDLERWLHNEPIQARAAGPVLRIGRWMKRNRVGTALILTLCLLLTTTVAFLIKIDHDRQEANRAKEKATQVAGEYKELLTEKDQVTYRLAVQAREKLEELWTRPDKKSLFITAEDLAALSGTTAVKVTNAASLLRLGIGLSANASPVNEARVYAPLLARLDQLMSERLGKEVRLDLTMYKISAERLPALARNELDFVRIGAYPVMKASQEKLPIQALVEQINPGRRATFFTRTNTGIKSLADLKGKAMAFGETNSTISFVAQMKLAEAGLAAGDFAKFDYLDSLSAFMKSVEEDGLEPVINRSGGVLSSHNEVIQAVRDGRYDAGVASLKILEKNARYGLVRIPGGEFDNIRNPWIGRATLPPEVRQAFIDAMTALSEQNDAFLRTLPDQPTGYRVITPETHAAERESIRKIEGLFPFKVPLNPDPARKTPRPTK